MVLGGVICVLEDFHLYSLMPIPLKPVLPEELSVIQTIHFPSTTGDLFIYGHDDRTVNRSANCAILCPRKSMPDASGKIAPFILY